MNYTVFGARGLIGRHLTAWLESKHIPCWTPGRSEDWSGRHLGHVIYCIGVTSDSRERPYDTVRAHVCHLLEILERAEFESFLYLSSTRVYHGQATTCEDAALWAEPGNREDLYNISKLMGESLCLNSNRSKVRVVRLSNVYPPDFSVGGFLSSVLIEAIERNRVVLRSSLNSVKDYIDMNTAVRLLQQIACAGARSIYNVASGTNISHKDIVEAVQRITGCAVEVQIQAPTILHPPINIQRIQQEFDLRSLPVMEAIPAMVSEYRRLKMNPLI
jgi:nucleoside-diphosphate-sugar epimerase